MTKLEKIKKATDLAEYYKNKKSWKIEEMQNFITKKYKILEADDEEDYLFDNLCFFGDWEEAYYGDQFLNNFIEFYKKNFMTNGTTDIDTLANDDKINFIYNGYNETYIINMKKINKLIKNKGFGIVNGDYIQKVAKWKR